MKKCIILAIILIFRLIAYPQLTGTRFVPSANFPDFKSIIDSLNLMGVGTGGVIFELAGGQVFNTPLVNLTAAGTEQNQIIIRWNQSGEKPILRFTGTSAAGEAAITLSGTDFLSMEGIDIQVLNNQLEYGILLTNASTTNGCHNNTFKNISVTLDKTNTNQTEAVRVVSLTAASNQSGIHYGNKFYNNLIRNCYIGYNLDSGTGTVSLMGFDNEIGAIDGGLSIIDDIVLCGVYLKGQNGAKVFKTSIINLERIGGGTTAPAAIATTSNNPDTQLSGIFDFYDNIIENHHSATTSIFGFYLNARKSVHKVYNNQIRNISATGGGSNAATGIIVFGTAITAYIYNNFISGIEAPATAISGYPGTRGIELRTYSQSYVMYNTVKLQFDATHTASISAPLSVENETDLTVIRNNIFINMATLPPQASGAAAAFFKSTTSLGNIDASSSNNFYFAGTPSNLHPIFYGYAATPVIKSTLAEYQLLASTFDQVAFTGQIQFVAENNLHIHPFDTQVRNRALPISQPLVINTDIDHLQRDSQTPDIGADELPELDLFAAVDPWPANAALLPVEAIDSLSWNYITDEYHILPDGFYVYISETPDFTGVEPYRIDFLPQLSQYSFLLNNYTLEYQKTYYWKVVPVAGDSNQIFVNEPYIWSFSTIYSYPAQAVCVSPADGMADVAVTTDTLVWSYTNLPYFSACYGFKVYFGTNSLLDDTDLAGFVVFDRLRSNHFFKLPVDSLEYETTYYWKIVPVAGSESGNPNPDCQTWHFTTVTQSGIADFSNSLKIYPNPANHFIRLYNPLQNKVLASVYSAKGQLLISKQIYGQIGLLDVSQFNPGIYFVNITNDKIHKRLKLIIE